MGESSKRFRSRRLPRKVQVCSIEPGVNLAHHIFRFFFLLLFFDLEHQKKKYYAPFFNGANAAGESSEKSGAEPELCKHKHEKKKLMLFRSSSMSRLVSRFSNS